MTTKPPNAKKEAAKARRVEDREALKEKLDREKRPDLWNKLSACGENLPLVCVNCGTKKMASVKCKRRWCPVCSYYIAVERVAKYKAVVRGFEWPLFVTLTMKNTVTPDGLKQMKDAFGKWRRRKLVREKVKSGIVGFEMTNKGNGWHPHCHMLLDCRWLSLHVPEPRRSDTGEEKRRKCVAAADELGRLWADVLKQKTASVLVRRGDAEALIEVLKYSVKGSELVEMDEEAAPVIDVMEGMRLMTTFGEVRKIKKDENPEEGEIGGCQCEKCLMIGTIVPESCVDFYMR